MTAPQTPVEALATALDAAFAPLDRGPLPHVGPVTLAGWTLAALPPGWHLTGPDETARIAAIEADAAAEALEAEVERLREALAELREAANVRYLTGRAPRYRLDKAIRQADAALAGPAEARTGS